MASFSTKFRYAYHVAPLHAFKPIWQKRALSSKAVLAGGEGVRRLTTAKVDELLGFSDFVHFYLPRQTEVDYSGLRILDAQMRKSSVPAFPHLVLVVDTKDLKDEDCTICNFNIAVSRPAYPGVLGGNHTRGTAPETIREHWRRFRASRPSEEKLRRSYWHDGLEVPVLAGKQITDKPARVGFGTKMPELLIRRRYAIRDADSFVVFSEFDLATVRLLSGLAQMQKTEAAELEWYAASDRVAKKDRDAIETYFKDADAPFPTDLNFDRIRPGSK
jgi:hypothetical protein